MRVIIFTVVLLRFLQTAAYISLFHFFLIKAKEPKRKRIAITLAIFVAVAVAYLALVIFGGLKIAENLVVPVEIGLCLILLIICSADKWRVGVFVMCTQFNLYLGISYLSDICATDSSALLYEIKYFVLRTVLFGAVLFINFKYLRLRFRRLVELLGKEWFPIAIAAVSFYILEAAIQYYPQMYWYERGYRWHLIGSSYVVFLAVYWLIFSSIGALNEKLKIQERESIYLLQNKMWGEQIEEQKNAVNAARRDRHDLRHHYDTLLSMLDSEKIQEAVSYLNIQTQRTESAVLAGVCEHLAANVILSRWVARAQKNRIKTEIDARVPANLPMDEIELVGILANSFENAVEGCLRCPDGTEKYIYAKIAYHDYNGAGKLHIVFENSCEDNLLFENGFPKSQKDGGGTGTKSITYTAERYKGMVEFTAQDCVFRTRVLLHLQH